MLEETHEWSKVRKEMREDCIRVHKASLLCPVLSSDADLWADNLTNFTWLGNSSFAKLAGIRRGGEALRRGIEIWRDFGATFQCFRCPLLWG